VEVAVGFSRVSAFLCPHPAGAPQAAGAAHARAVLTQAVPLVGLEAARSGLVLAPGGLGQRIGQATGEDSLCHGSFGG